MRASRSMVCAVLAAGLLAAGKPAAVTAGRGASSEPASEQDSLYQFEYSYPRVVRTIPLLRARLDAERDKARAALKKEATEAKAEARKGGYDFHGFYLSTIWDVEADLPGWLSLSAGSESFTGGAHGMRWFSARLWDKAAKRERAATDLFLSRAAFSAAIRESFCDKLDEERAERRGEPVQRDSGEVFDACIDPAEGAVILGSSDKVRFTWISVLIDPYAAGPWVEGSYVVTVPVTPAVLMAVRPEYRRFFAARP